MRRTPFRRRILIYSSALLITLVVAMLASINYLGGRFARSTIERQIEDGRLRITGVEQQRVRELWLTARFVASYPTLKSIILETDPPTRRDYLLAYLRDNKSDLLLMLLDSRGNVLARTDKTDPLPAPELSAVVQSPPEESTSFIINANAGIITSRSYRWRPQVKPMAMWSPVRKLTGVLLKNFRT